MNRKWLNFMEFLLVIVVAFIMMYVYGYGYFETLLIPMVILIYFQISKIKSILYLIWKS